MKYLKQITIIFSITFLGETIKYLLPFPIPSSIYGLFIMLILLKLKILKVEDIKISANFLINLMPIMFIPPAITLVNVWGSILSKLIFYLILIILSTTLVMISSGVVTQKILNIMEHRND